MFLTVSAMWLAAPVLRAAVPTCGQFECATPLAVRLRLQQLHEFSLLHNYLISAAAAGFHWLFSFVQLTLAPVFMVEGL